MNAWILNAWILGVAGAGAAVTGLFRGARRRRLSALAAGGRTVRLTELGAKAELIEIDLGYGLEVWRIASGEDPRFCKRSRSIENGLLVLEDRGAPAPARTAHAAGFATPRAGVKF
jgi:hypothetical protein